MKEKMLEQFKFSDELKRKAGAACGLSKSPPKRPCKQYGFPNAHMLVNWVNIYKRLLENGAITLPPMQSKKKKDTPALKQRIKQLEKFLYQFLNICIGHWIKRRFFAYKLALICHVKNRRPC
jgi:hypothetical protein